MAKTIGIEDIIGATLASIERTKIDGEDALVFKASDGRIWNMRHSRDCCEDVHIEDITGDMDLLLGEPVLLAEEATNQENPLVPNEESFTWTFYKLQTNHGDVTIRWYGSSNGYYSEEVSFYRVVDGEEKRWEN